MGRFVLRRTEDGRFKAAQIIGNAAIGGVRACVLNYMRFCDRSRFRFDFFIYGHGDFDGQVHGIDPASAIYTIPRIERDPLGAMHALRRILREEGYAIAHSHMTALSAFVLPAAKRAGVPVRICHAHSSFDRQSDRYLAKALLRPFAAACATHRMACGRLTAESLYRGRAEEAFLLPNAIDLAHFAPGAGAKDKLGLAGQVLLFVGRFVPQKNLFFLLRAFARARAMRPLTLVLLGAGEQGAALRACAAECGIAESALFLPQQDPAPWYAAADALVLPSLYEGMPVVAAEAQAAGLHCLFSDKVTREADICGGAEFLPLDEEIWARAMAAPQPPKADNMQKLRAAHYDIRTEGARLTDFYESALRGAGIG